ncbi:zinc metalloproteinase nas-14-like isoform X2 [Paramacrobiotus metropolitanus]|nr:zinc metalloproteinase nas-14-like isoform X2 [Paramacrobiotus metropolitanus]
MRAIEWRTAGCVTFQKRKGNHQEYILIQHQIGPKAICKADVGRSIGRPTRVRLHSDCFSLAIPGIIQHEIMHALGFHHEHSRPDRDDHITLVASNMKSGIDERNFQKLPRMATFGLPYDIESLLHYGQEVSKSHDKPAIISKAIPPARWIGQQFGLSPLDVTKLKVAYNCSQKEAAVTVPTFSATPARIDRHSVTSGPTFNEYAATEDYPINTSVADPPFVYPIPKMANEPLTKEQCLRGESANCQKPGWLRGHRAMETPYYFTTCNRTATQMELLIMFREMSQPPLRYVRLRLEDSEHVTGEALQPIRTQVIHLSLYGCHTNRVTGKLRGMALGNLLRFGAFGTGCSDCLVMQKLVFSTSLKLREIQFLWHVIQSVEVDSFSDMVDLRILSLPLSREQHCSPSFVWYRRWLSRHSYLAKTRSMGSVYNTQTDWDRSIFNLDVMESDVSPLFIRCG